MSLDLWRERHQPGTEAEYLGRTTDNAVEHALRTLRTEFDAKDFQLNERRVDIDKLAAERDALQARIDAGRQLCHKYDGDCGDAVRLAEAVYSALRHDNPAPPADDGSEAEQEATFVPDAKYGARWALKPSPSVAKAEEMLADPEAYFAKARGRDLLDGYEPEDDAENESPPFTVGQYVRDTDGYVWRVTDCHLEGFTWMVARKRGDWLSTQHASKLEPWRPLLGESVIHVGGAHEYPSTVTQVYSDGSYAVRHNADGSESVVTVDKLRPAQGGDE